MENIAIFYGGKSVEHEVSVITGLQVIENIDKEKFNIFPVFIDKDGLWWSVRDFKNKKTYANIKQEKKKQVFVAMGFACLFLKGFLTKKVKIDAVINCCHGTNGEDGVLEGVFQSMGVPSSGPDVLSSAICMNKIITKQLFDFYALPKTDYFSFKRDEKIDIDKVIEKLGFPVFVKPANLGSSVGISKCESANEIKNALEIAFSFDEYVILEKAVQNLKEINCSVQKIDGKIVASELEMPISWEKFLTYEEKYVQKNKNEKKRVVGVKIDKKIEKQIIDMSCFVYEKFDLDGCIRIDYLFDTKEKKVYINEINTIPGSLAFYLWKPKGISLKQHITLQIEQAKQKQKLKDKNKTNFNSNILLS